MTSTDFETDILEQLDFDLKCDFERCEKVADWICWTKCCGNTMLFCDPHLKETIEWGNSGGLHHCPKCDTSGISGNPFVKMEKIR